MSFYCLSLSISLVQGDGHNVILQLNRPYVVTAMKLKVILGDDHQLSSKARYGK